MGNLVEVLLPTGGTAALVAISIRLLNLYAGALKHAPDAMLQRRMFWTPLVITLLFSVATFSGAIYLTDLRSRRRAENIAALARAEDAHAQSAFVYTCYQANSLRAESAARGQSGAQLFEVLRSSQIITDPQILFAIDKAIIDLTHAGPILDCTWPPIHVPPPVSGPSATVPIAK